MLETMKIGNKAVSFGLQVSRAKHTASSGWIVGNPKLEEKLTYIMRVYEEFIGLREVKLAQAKVIEAETKFKQAQERRMQQQQQMLNIQKSLREIHAELDKTARGEDRYLQLITKEHSLLKEDRALLAEFRATEKQEYDNFSMLSFALRESHEKERAQAEKTKYWSIIGSITGTLIGALVSTLTNRYRMQQLREMISTASSKSATASDLMEQIRDSLDRRKNPSEDPTAGAASDSSAASLEDAVTELIDRTAHLEKVVEQYSAVNIGLLSTILVITPLVGWMLSR
ncbi:coiled-coil domain-containing protein 51 [Galendromus occidentalis]|uniref:Coiled-coil domain-containing protein 51 n=1 Tax=Galendromus occidentalis TaxID=34638 RepID=A0AAJ6QR10_9ACAR|nr:coiled-coil domain-containing protein 51 [Galendromus occidentalis]